MRFFALWLRLLIFQKFYLLLSFCPKHVSNIKKRSFLLNSDAVADVIDGWSKAFYPTFLSKYWTKKPLLIRNAISPSYLHDIVSPSDLQFLSYDEDVESRTIVNRNGVWVKEYGAFPSNHYEKLQKRGYPWTVLVQEVDRYYFLSNES